MGVRFPDFVDVGELQGLFDDFSAFTTVATAILDLDGRILVASGWQDLCTRFHRVHPTTAARCLESDTVLAGHLSSGGSYNVYRCKNGLIDVAVPITIGGVHVANFFIGQFFFEPPQKEFFLRQAAEFGFDRTAYLDALNRVPVYSERQVATLMAYFTRQVKLLGEMGLSRRNLEEANSALRESEERLNVTLRSIGDGVITTDTNGVVVLMNRVAEMLTGWTQDEAKGLPLREVFRVVNEKTRAPREDPVARVLASGRAVDLANHAILVSRDGTERVLADSGAPIHDRQGWIVGVVMVFRDVTERSRMEEELQRAQKLDSVGRLAGGIAHDFNNLLTGILGNVVLARIEAPSESRSAERLREAEKAVRRAADLTHQLLTFSKGGAPVRKVARLRELICDSAGFSLRGSNVRCEFAIPEDLWPVEVDEGQMSQVIGNLVVNADQAMPDGGVIRVSARNLPPGGTLPGQLPDGRYVEVSVEDHGIGIPEEHLSRIFEPYFTTKEKGSGLGLATCYSIVRKHDGQITVTSLMGEGSTFRVYLPASAKDALPRVVEEDFVPGHGRILLMDDEEEIRGVCSQMLAHLGYDVDTARDGAEVLQMYIAARTSGRPFDVVILDLTVPGGTGGREAFRKLRELDPNVRAIVSSGYSNDPIMADFRAHGFRGVMLKPYDLRLLSRVVHEVLAS